MLNITVNIYYIKNLHWSMWSTIISSTLWRVIAVRQHSKPNLRLRNTNSINLLWESVRSAYWREPWKQTGHDSSVEVRHKPQNNFTRGGQAASFIFRIKVWNL
jgi:hypothetical protein